MDDQERAEQEIAHRESQAFDPAPANEAEFVALAKRLESYDRHDGLPVEAVDIHDTNAAATAIRQLLARVAALQAGIRGWLLGESAIDDMAALLPALPGAADQDTGREK